MSVLNTYCFFLIGVYRLSRWHASFHTHFGFTCFIVLAIQKRIGTVLFCCMLQLYIVHCSIKARKTKRIGRLNMLHFLVYSILFSQTACYHQSRTYWRRLVFPNSSALCPALPHQSNRRKMHRRIDFFHAIFLVCTFLLAQRILVQIEQSALAQSCFAS